MKTVILSAVFLSVILWSRFNKTDVEQPTYIDTCGKISPKIKNSNKKNDLIYMDLIHPGNNFKTLFKMYSGPNPKGDGC